MASQYPWLNSCTKIGNKIVLHKVRKFSEKKNCLRFNKMENSKSGINRKYKMDKNLYFQLTQLVHVIPNY